MLETRVRGFQALCAVRLGLALGCRCSPHATLLLPALTDCSMHPEPRTASSDPCGTSVRRAVLQCAPRALLLDGLKNIHVSVQSKTTPAQIDLANTS